MTARPWMCWTVAWLLLIAVNLLGFTAHGIDGLVAGYYTTRWADKVRKQNTANKTTEPHK